MIKKQDLSNLDFDEQTEKAFARILKTASICEQSSLKMKRKLVAAGFSQKVIDSAMERAYKVRAIDDRRYAECLIRQAISFGKGMDAVEREISKLDVDIFTLDAYTEYLENADQTQLEAALDVLKSHPPRAKNKYNAAFRKLISKGFSSSITSKAVSIWWSENDGV